MDRNEKRQQLMSRLDDTIRELVELSAPEDPDGNHILTVAEWALSIGLMEYANGVRVDDDIVIVADDDVPVWRLKGLLDSALTKFRAMETHTAFTDMHMILGDEELDEGDDA